VISLTHIPCWFNPSNASFFGSGV